MESHFVRSIPTTGLVYLSVVDSASSTRSGAIWKIDFHDQTTGYEQGLSRAVRDQWLKTESIGRLVMGSGSHREVWHADQPFRGAAELVRQGIWCFRVGGDGKFMAYRATDGKPLWEFDTGVGIMAGPMTYSVNGTQYVAVMAGWESHNTRQSNRQQRKDRAGRLWLFRSEEPPLHRVEQSHPFPCRPSNLLYHCVRVRLIRDPICMLRSVRCHRADVVSSGVGAGPPLPPVIDASNISTDRSRQRFA